MATTSNPQSPADYLWPAAATGPASNAAAESSVTTRSADNRGPARQDQLDPSRRLTPYGADASGSTTASSPNETRYIAPASFLTQIPGPSKGSLDQVIADYMTGGGDASSNDTFELIRVLGSRDPAQAGATKPSDSPTVDSAVADYKRSADYAAGLSLAVSLTQSFNSSVKRLTQGQ